MYCIVVKLFINFSISESGFDFSGSDDWFDLFIILIICFIYRFVDLFVVWFLLMILLLFCFSFIILFISCFDDLLVNTLFW